MIWLPIEAIKNNFDNPLLTFGICWLYRKEQYSPWLCPETYVMKELKAYGWAYSRVMRAAFPTDWGKANHLLESKQTR